MKKITNLFHSVPKKLARIRVQVFRNNNADKLGLDNGENCKTGNKQSHVT